MKKSELVAQLADANDLSRRQAEKIIDDFLELIADELSRGEKVVLSGFGTFEVRTRVARSGRNPRTGEEINVPEQKTPAFKVGKILKDAVNK
ncbi:MAG: HU family DNA-binding protein [Acholeplasmatales bacterium]|nr:HU family DNA-binding protein [Acholeplasmatales bacterium]